MASELRATDAPWHVRSAERITAALSRQPRCAHCERRSIVELDNEPLCFDHARQWLRGENERNAA